MTIEQRVAQHYGRASLEQRILEAVAKAGKDPAHLTADDLALTDEFHIGGRPATVELAGQLDLRPDMLLLDIGCGIGGPARYFAQHHRCRVTGIDLTEEFVRVATALSRRVGLGDRITFLQGSALALPFEPRSFDRATMIHVGMNIADKARLFAEVARVLAPGGFFAVYDVMRRGEGDLAFPVPWARTPETSFLADPAAYRRLLGEAGFAIVRERDRYAFAIEFFRKMRERMGESGPPVLGLHPVMGADSRAMIANMIANLERGLIAPVEMIARIA